MSKSVLTPKETSVYKYLCEQQSLGFSPSIREICKACDIKSTSGVHAVLKSLEEKGYIERPKAASRSIRLSNRAPSKSVPILGEIAAQKLTWSFAEYLILGVTMATNMVTEFLFCRFVVYGKSINTAEK